MCNEEDGEERMRERRLAGGAGLVGCRGKLLNADTFVLLALTISNRKCHSSVLHS